MKCPLLKITRPGMWKEGTNPSDDCLEAECAWWVESSQKCTLREMRDWLESIDNYLYEIKCYMPHETQFRR